MSIPRSIIEKLPFFLNGTLSEDERLEVERELARSEELRAELEQVREAARIFGHRLPAEALVSYVFDGVTEGLPADLIERHLAASPGAREEYELLVESRDALDRSRGAEAPADGNVVAGRFAPATAAASGWRRLALAASIVGAASLALAGWQWSRLSEGEARLADVESRLEEALEERDPAPQPAGEGGEEARQQIEELRLENEQLAAGKSDLVDQVARQEEQIVRLGEQIAALEQPRANLPVIDLYPGDMVLRGETPSDSATVLERSAGAVALILNSGAAGDDRLERMRIVDAAGAEVWASREAPLRDELGTFTVSVPTGTFEAGSYTIELIGRLGGEGESTVVESYLVEIR